MRSDHYLGHLDNARRRAAWLLGALLLMAGVAALSTYGFYRAAGSQRVVLMPPEMAGPISFAGGRYDERYLSQMAHWFSSLTLTYHPDNYDYQVRTFLRYVHPSAHAALSATLENERAEIMRKRYASVFFPEGVIVRGQSVAIRGMQKRYVGSTETGSREATWIVKFDVLATGQIAVSSIKEVDNDEPFAGSVAAHDRR